MSAYGGTICPICKGAGNIVTFLRGVEYWRCPCCGGAGVRTQYGPRSIGERRTAQ